jgi:hypothetical protein
MKNKDCFETYEAAREQYETIIVPQFGATRMDWGFGRWLWLDVIDDPLKAWLAMDEARILTNAGKKLLARMIRDGAK